MDGLYTGISEGTIIQLKSKSELDEDIDKNAKGTINLFKSEYKTYTHFELENIMTTKKVQLGTTCIFEIDNGEGDLISNIMLKIKLPTIPITVDRISKSTIYRFWTNRIICSMIKTITVKHGNNTLLTLDSDSLFINSELNVSSSKQKMYDVMTGNHHTIQSMIEYSNIDDNEYFLDIPLFKNFDQLQYFPINNARNKDSKLKVYITLKDLTKLMLKSSYYETNLEINDDYSNIDDNVYISLMCNHILLSRNEAVSLLTSNNNFLIENYHLNEFTNFNRDNNKVIETKYQLSLNHPTKQLIVVITRKEDEDNNKYHNYIEIDNIELYIDGKKMNDEIYVKRNNSKKNFNINKNKKSPRYNIYSLSFAFVPGIYQPTGHLNFSKANNIFIKIKLKQYEEVIIRVYSSELNIYKTNSNGEGKYDNI